MLTKESTINLNLAAKVYFKYDSSTNEIRTFFSKLEGIFFSPIMKLTKNFIFLGSIYELKQLLLKLYFSHTLD